MFYYNFQIFYHIFIVFVNTFCNAFYKFLLNDPQPHHFPSGHPSWNTTLQQWFRTCIGHGKEKENASFRSLPSPIPHLDIWWGIDLQYTACVFVCK